MQVCILKGNKMEILIIIGQILLITIFTLLYIYIKKIPEQIHAMQLSNYEHELNKQMEIFRTELIKEMELMRISHTELQSHKSEEFINLVEFLYKSMLDKEYLRKLETNLKVQKEFNNKMSTLGTKLFFFASDDTVKKYVEWRKHGLRVDEEAGGVDKNRIVILLAELMVLIRRDLGYKDTNCTKDDFLNIMLNDWHKYEGQY